MDRSWLYLHDGALGAVECGQHRFLQEPRKSQSLLMPKPSIPTTKAQHWPALTHLLGSPTPTFSQARRGRDSQTPQGQSLLQGEPALTEATWKELFVPL